MSYKKIILCFCLLFSSTHSHCNEKIVDACVAIILLGCGLSILDGIINNFDNIKYIINYLRYYVFNCNPNIQDQYGWSPLYDACYDNKIEIINLLLNHPKIDPNIKNNNGFTPLYSACINNQIESIKLLLNHQETDPNIQDKNGWSPLYDACYDNKIEIINLLLNHPKIDPNIKNNNGFTPLYSACINNKIEIINLLLSHPKIKNDENYQQTELHKVCLDNATSADTIKALLKTFHPDIRNSEGNPALILSVLHHNNPHIINLLIEHGASVSITDKNNYSFLYYSYTFQRIKNVNDLDFIKRATQIKKTTFLNNELHTLCTTISDDQTLTSNTCAFASWCIDQGANIYSKNKQNLEPINVIEKLLHDPSLKSKSHYEKLHTTFLMEKTESYIYYTYKQLNIPNDIIKTILGYYTAITMGEKNKEYIEQKCKNRGYISPYQKL